MIPENIRTLLSSREAAFLEEAINQWPAHNGLSLQAKSITVQMGWNPSDDELMGLIGGLEGKGLIVDVRQTLGGPSFFISPILWATLKPPLR